MQDLIKGLNEPQREAVLHMAGPLMIIAGAGSGKTKVLTTRIAHLIHQGVDPFNIMALTFTNKAAQEMRERIGHLLNSSEPRNLYIGTFHSVFARLLRAEADKLGYPKNFTIYDTDDAKSVVKAVLAELNLDDKMYKPNVVYNRISAAKNSLFGPRQYLQDASIQQEDARASRPELGNIYKRYTEKCFRNGAMDFDDLLYKMYELLIRFPEVLVKYQHRFQYILIDEYQDTNVAQYKIIKLMAAVNENICVVGDDAQSIYSFRGATVQNILEFQNDYPDAQVVKLEQNYRSTRSILEVANTIIANNKNQIPKNLWTKNTDGDKIKLVRTMTDNDEGRFVADAIQEMKLRNHYNNYDFCVLYRTNAQSRSFEESLRRMNIPYRIVGGVSFYQRKEIKDFLAYLRVIVNPNDEENIKRIINYPARGIGKTTLERLILAANTQDKTLWEVMPHAAITGISAATQQKLDQFLLLIKTFSSMLEKNNAYEVAFEVGKHTGLVKELYNDKTVEGLARYENIQELLNSIKEYTETPDEEGVLDQKTLGNYLQQISLLTDADNDENNKDVVKLMTIHAAKGLEFPAVFVVGLEENLFPSQMSLYDREDLEEERRLFYVAITRAKEKLWLSLSSSRYRFGSLIQNDPSRFLNEIPEALTDRSFTGIGNAASRNFQNSNSKAARHTSSTTDSSIKKIAEQLRQKTSSHKPSANFVADHFMEMKEGMRVEHQKFGFGTIEKIEGSAANPLAHIRFELSQELKKIMLQYAKLQIVKV